MAKYIPQTPYTVNSRLHEHQKAFLSQTVNSHTTEEMSCKNNTPNSQNIGSWLKT